jgi:hypothetical protein
VKIDQLNREISALVPAPGFRGCARLSRDPDTGGRVDPYLLFKFDDPDALTAQQLADLDAALAAHSPRPDPPPPDLRAEYRAAQTVAAKLDVLARALQLA